MVSEPQLAGSCRKRVGMPEAPLAFIGIIALVGLVSWSTVAGIRAYALKRGVLDQPSSRSSHLAPTPRGGGAGLVAATLIGFLVLTPTSTLTWRVVLALCAVIPTAIVGWFDDHGSLPVWPRAAAHLLSGLLIVPLAVSVPAPGIPVFIAAAGWVLITLSAINVVNFMDGIDGLIGLQTLVFGAHLGLLGGPSSLGGALGVALAASAVGFLAWNWAPAKIFLGDVGSGSVAILGLLAGLLVWGTQRFPFVLIFLPLVPIFLDAAATVVWRARRGERLTQAHRSHLYQRLANESGWGHAPVSLVYGLGAIAGVVAVQISLWAGSIVVIGIYFVLAIAGGAVLERSARRS